jgi:hypothetical protein
VTEALVVFGLVGLLVLFGTMALLLPLEILVLAGVVCIAAGFMLGVPAGTYYHVKLYRALAAHGGVPRGFFWHPTRYHASVPPNEWRNIVPWFAAGAIGFVLILVGCAIVMLGMLRA